ncbi:DUF2490 domain-containing protein [Spirosoma sp. KUDC1026]|uniref:DUF2490 domain-containing protein n=1 Tax=Spirosoma sp. KUDC1026 TaxID=2745947 RepID=UPI00159B9EE1|nr:DUF2490 domain-containing protein [Spirosoma sp. KUDC1026]QKZ14219.1 DUF2490 domain-containing protein [Spirosoma sp. KUDC1026]
MRFPFLLFILLPISCYVSAQQTRLLDPNTIGWFTYNGDHKLGKRWELHTEYQWRRTDFLHSMQQSLARVGTNYQLNDRVSVGGGYTNLTTYPYGDYPEDDVMTFEHRSYEDLNISDQLGLVSLSHRFRLEQRWLSVGADANPRDIVDWEFQNRIRYQISGKIPLQGQRIDNGEFYANFFAELFIGFGQNVGNDIFNQNRLSAGPGYQIRDNLKLELNYINQIKQHATPEPTSDRPVFEINNGFRLNVVYNLDFTK